MRQKQKAELLAQLAGRLLRPGLEKAFFLQGAYGAGTNLYFDLFTVHGQGFSLQVRLPSLFGVAHRKADITAVLFALFIKIKSLHNQGVILPYLPLSV